MLNYSDLASNFSGVIDVGNGVIKCKDALPRAVFYYYVKIANGDGDDLLVVSENKEDDEFASLLFANVSMKEEHVGLSLYPLSNNNYGFSTILLASKDYHGYFKGRLDEKRNKLVLCLPVHRCEFSGTETLEEFFYLRREIVPTLNWSRTVSPKIEMRFDNPKTGGGTGDSSVFVKYDSVLREIANMEGVVNGFIEIINYSGSIVEIISPAVDQYVIIRNRDDSMRESCPKDLLLDKLWLFLTE